MADMTQPPDQPPYTQGYPQQQGGYQPPPGQPAQGWQQPAYGQPQGWGGYGGGGGRRSFRIDWRQDWGYVAAGGVSILTFIFLFLPWASSSIPGDGSINAFGDSELENYNPGSIWAILTILTVLATIGAAVAFLFLRRKEIGYGVVGASALTALWMLIALLVFNGKIGDINNVLGSADEGGSVSLGVGAWLGLIVGIIALGCAIAGLVILQKAGPGGGSAIQYGSGLGGYGGQQGGYPGGQQIGYPGQQPGGGYPPPQGGYPPAGGGYPPQGGGYPPDGGGYPPQGGGYPGQ